MKKKETNSSHKQPSKSKKVNQVDKKWIYLTALAITILTFFAFYPALDNEFTNWDDEGYIVDNHLLRDISPQGIKAMFKENVEGNFHPLTVLSYAIEFHFVKLDPKLYHVTNVVFHLFNTLLVFAFFMLLTGRIEIAGFTSLLFGVHPMHVESVAWVSERKDVLYAFFYLGALIMYYYYIKKEKSKWVYFTGAILLFVLSILSKGMAVSLPLVLVAIDLYLKRKFTGKTIVEKVPFFVLSLIFGLVAVYYQHSSDAIQDSTIFSFHDRILFAGYGFMTYLAKLVIPYKLSAFYPYSFKTNGFYPIEFYLAPLLVLVLFVLVFLSFRNGKRSIFFGFAFYAITIALVIQLLPVGSTIMSDRYTYLPYIGIFFIIGWAYIKYTDAGAKFSGLRIPAIAILGIYSLSMIFVTRVRCDVWQNSFTLWDDVIKKYPQVPVAHNNWGLYHKNIGKYDIALKAYNKAVEVDPKYRETYENRGNIYFLTQKYELALKDLNKALEMDSKSPVAFNSRGAVNFNLGKYEDALSDFNAAIKHDPYLYDAYGNRANCLSVMGKFAEALPDYNVFLRNEPKHSNGHYWRALVKFNLGKTDDAILDFNLAIKFNTGNANAYLDRSKAYASKNEFGKALQDAMKARELGKEVEEGYIVMLQSKGG